jgi:hypothetical protein
VLEASEVTSTNYVCNGSNGASASAGSNGFNSLVDIVSESVGANCAYAGKKITSGLDGNGDGVLENTEVTATSYVCNGAPGPGITWVDVTGTAVLALLNTGYLADNISQVVITLPTSPAVGDLIQVSGIGAGGWRISQNAGQTIVTDNLEGGAVGNIWTARESLRSWHSVASSADGARLVAAVNGGQIYTSADSGVTWTARDSNRNWFAVASSANGARLVAVEFGGQIYTSTDSGVTWTPQESSRGWRSVASSADGTRLVAVDSGDLITAFSGQIYTSIDSGVTWTAQDSNRNWHSVASSADGTRLVAAVMIAGQIYTSTPTPMRSTSTGGAGSISGRQYDAIDLQYAGSGVFLVRGSAGVFNVQ